LLEAYRELGKIEPKKKILAQKDFQFLFYWVFGRKRFSLTKEEVSGGDLKKKKEKSGGKISVYQKKSFLSAATGF